MADALGTTFELCWGTSTVTTYVESAAGVSEGGRTGMTSVDNCHMFCCCIVRAPLVFWQFRAATAPALILCRFIYDCSYQGTWFQRLFWIDSAFICILAYATLHTALPKELHLGVLVMYSSTHCRKIKNYPLGCTFSLSCLFWKYIYLRYSLNDSQQKPSASQQAF